MRKHLQTRSGRISLSIAAVIAVVLVVAVAVIIYFFGSLGFIGGGNAQSTNNGPITAPTLAPTQNGTIFTIDSSTSEASFTMHEVLFGQANTVVGKTSQVAGQIRVDQANPSQSQVGEIRVDLSSLATDSDLRNQAIRHRILETDQSSNQFATFVTKSISGMPSTITVGQTVTFQITGDLTIHQVTRSTTFDVQVTVQSASVLTGQAQATVKYKDFGLAIPNVPSVTGVSETVTLALTFTAHT
jgi:polyisoprenoid-binding protein YceI